MKYIGIIGISLVILASGAIIAYGIVSYGSKKPVSTPSPLPTLPPVTKTITRNTATTSADLEDSIIINAKEYEFDPEILTLPKGEKVTLQLKNKGKMIHDFVIEGTSIKTKVISGGETDTIEFQIDKEGEYTFYCSVAGHREAGMVGKIIVK